MAEGPGQRAHRRVGTMIRDKYRIDAFIATGSMANVYAATHRNGSRVALKVLHRELARDPSMAERFRREGYFANAIGHPGVVRAIDDDVAEDGCAFIVMELLEGENLEERRQRLGGRVPLAEALQIADAMLDVLSAAHAHEILHRDLKPENVFITRKNEVKLLDFGVARFNDGRRSSDMTDVGMVLGTPAFMPPEQARGRREDVDVRSDIWAAGATLFTVIAGQAVHLGGDAKTKLIATARTPARRIREVAPETPRAVASVIDRALAFDKAERWADAAAMREALRWARMSLDGETSTQLERLEHDAITPPVPTRRTPEDEPTLAGRPQSRDSGFEESTAKRRTGPVARPPPSDGVFTSVAPITQREHPPSMAMSEDPTFSLRNDPVFSLRRSPPELAPITERMPADYAEERPTSPGSQAMPDPAALFQAALADSPLAFDDDSFDARTLPRFDHRAARESASAMEADWKRAAPRPAAGAPPETMPQVRAAPPVSAPHAHPKTSPSMRTAPGIGPPPRAANPDDPTLSGPHSSAPPAAAGREVRSAPPPNVAASGQRVSGPPAAASAEVRSAPPPMLAATAPFVDAAAPAPLAGAPRNGAARPSGAPESPGPLLATIVPKRSGGIIRVLVPIAIGLLAGVVTYVLAVRHREANASRASAPAMATATPQPTMTAAPAPLTTAQPAGATTTAPDAPTVAPSPSEAAPSAATAATSAPPKKARPRPKKPSPPATSDATASELTPPPPPPEDAPPDRDTATD